MATVDGAGSAWNNEGSLKMGAMLGGSSLTVKNRGQLTTQSLSVAVNGTSSVEIDGTGSSITASNALTIGLSDFSIGTLTVKNGGHLTTAAASIGRFLGNPFDPSSASVVVRDTGSLWTVNGQLAIGIYGDNHLTILDGAEVNVSAGTYVTQGGNLQGNGTLTGNLTNNGNVAPGNPVGSLHINGNYTSDPLPTFNTLTIELGGTTAGDQYDQLLITGNATFDGLLDVTLINGFTPQLGNTFNILDFAGATGTFDSVNLPSLPTGLVWSTAQLYTTGVIQVTSDGIPGDYNNGVVDSADYVVWRNSIGTTQTLPNDPTGGTIGNTQYNTWRSHFGQTAGSGAGVGTATSTAIPEPSSLLLLLMAGALRVARGRNTR